MAAKKTLLKPKKKMIRRSKMLKSEPVASVPKENISEQGTIKLSDTQRLTLNWEGAELRSIKATLRLKSSEYESILKRIDPQGTLRKLQAEIASLDASAKSYESKFAESCRSIARSLNMDPGKKWSYDDVTGIVHMEEAPPPSA